jgi:hypothetical protein
MSHHPRTDQRTVPPGRLPRLRHQEALIRSEIRRLARHHDLPEPRLDVLPALPLEGAQQVEGPIFQR